MFFNSRKIGLASLLSHVFLARQDISNSIFQHACIGQSLDKKQQGFINKRRVEYGFLRVGCLTGSQQ